MTFSGANNRGPSVAELQRYIREQATLTISLSNGDKVTGKLRWADETAFQVVPDGQQPFTILRSAVLGYQKVDGGQPAPKKKEAPKEKAAVAADAAPAAEAAPAEAASAAAEKTDDV